MTFLLNHKCTGTQYVAPVIASIDHMMSLIFFGSGPLTQKEINEPSH